MSEHSEEFVGGPPEQPGAAEPEPHDVMHMFHGLPNRKRRQRAAPKSNLPASGTQQQQTMMGAQIAADPVNPGKTRPIDTTQRSYQAIAGLAANEKALKNDMMSSQAQPADGTMSAIAADPELTGVGGGLAELTQGDGQIADHFTSQYEQALLRVQKSREMQSVNSSLANTSQSVAGGQSASAHGSKGNKFIPSKQRNHSQMGDHTRNLDLQRSQESLYSKRRAEGPDDSRLEGDEGTGLPDRMQAMGAQGEVQQNTKIRNQSMIAQYAPGPPLTWDQNLSLLQAHRRHAGAARTMYQAAALTPNAQSGTKSMSFAHLNDQSVSRPGLAQVNMSNLVQPNDDHISFSIKNQLQMQLQYAEAQEEEFRQILRLKRKRVATLQQQLSPEKAAGEADAPKMEESTEPKDGGGHSAAATDRKHGEEEIDFLLILRQQTVHLQERLKIEIRHKLTLMKHVSSLQRQLKASKEREAKMMNWQQTAPEEAVEASRTSAQQLNTVATQTEPALDLSRYERDLQEAGRAVRAGKSVLEDDAKDTGKDASQIFQAQFQPDLMGEPADQTQEKAPDNSLMFLEHQNSSSLPYHEVHNNYNAGTDKNDVSDFKVAQQTFVSRLLPDSVVLPDLDAAKEDSQSAERRHNGPPSHSKILQHISEASGFIDHMQQETSGVGSSIQRDDEMSQVLKAADLNKTISSSASPLKFKLNETVQNQDSPGMNVPRNVDINKTDGDIYNKGRSEAPSFGPRHDRKGPEDIAPAPPAGRGGQRDKHSQAAHQKDSESMLPRPGRDNMNVILESLNETQSHLNDQSIDQRQEEHLLHMQEVHHTGAHEPSQFIEELVDGGRGSEALPAFGGRSAAHTLDEEERRKIQMQWRRNIVQNHRRSQIDAQQKNQAENEEAPGNQTQRVSLKEYSLNLGKGAVTRDSLKRASEAEGSLLNPQDSYQRERTNSYHLIKYTSSQLAHSAHTPADNTHKRKRTSVQDAEHVQAQAARAIAANNEKPGKDYKAMFQLLLEEKKRQVKNTKELIDKIHGLTDEIKVLKQKNKQLSTVINRFGNLDNHFEFPMATAQNMSQAQQQQTLTKFVQDQYDEILQEQIYNQSVNFNLDQKHLQGAGQTNLNHDQTVVANKLHQDDRDILIQHFNQGRDSHDPRGSRDQRHADAVLTDRQQASISPYKYKDPRLSTEKAAFMARNSNSRPQNRFSANEHDISQSNFANVTHIHGIGQDSIPKTQNIEIRMRNRLQRQDQQAHHNRKMEKSPNAIHHMSQHERNSIKEKIASARGNPPKYLQRPQQVAGDNSFNVDVEESNIMSAGSASRQKKSIRDVHEHAMEMRQEPPTYMASPPAGDFNSQSKMSHGRSARNAVYSKEYQADILQSQAAGLDKIEAHMLDERPSIESGTNYNTMNQTSVDGERRSDPRQMLTKDQRRKLGSNSKGKKSKSGSGFMSIIKKKLLRSSAKGEPLVDKKQVRKRPSVGPAYEARGLQKQDGKVGGDDSHRRRDVSNDISARARSVGAKDDEGYEGFYNFGAEDDEAWSVDNSLRLQNSENLPRKEHKELDFKNLTQKNAAYGDPQRETYNQRDTLDFEEKISSKQQYKEARKKIKEDSKAARNQFKHQQAHRLSFNPGQYNANQFLQQQVKQEAEEHRNHFLADPRGTFNPVEGQVLQKQDSANFGGAGRREQDSLHLDDKHRQAEKMNLQFGQLAGGGGIEAQNPAVNIFGQHLGGPQQSFNVSAIQRDKDASQFFINHTNISIQNSFFNNASFMGAAGGHQQMAANFGGGPSMTMQSQLGQGAGSFAPMSQGARPPDLGQNPHRSEHADDAHYHQSASSKNQIKEQFLRMSMRAKQAPGGSSSSSSTLAKAAADQSGHSNAADPRSTSPIEAAMSMRMSMMSNTGHASSRHDVSAMSSSLKLQNKQQRRKDHGKETKGLVFQDASKNR